MDREDLDGLAADERVDEVLRLVSKQEIAETWMRYHREKRDSDWWAVHLWMTKPWWSDEARVRDGIIRLVDLAETEDDFAIIAAAVMEVFVCDDVSRLHWIERQAASSEAFRRAMRTIWVWELPDRAFRRMERAAGVRLLDREPERRARRLNET
jgi:hypothetical protein